MSSDLSTEEMALPGKERARDPLVADGHGRRARSRAAHDPGSRPLSQPAP